MKNLKTTSTSVKFPNGCANYVLEFIPWTLLWLILGAPSGEISVHSLVGIRFWKKHTGSTPFKNIFYSTAKECVISQNLGLCICFFRLCKILLPTQCPGWFLCLSAPGLPVTSGAVQIMGGNSEWVFYSSDSLSTSDLQDCTNESWKTSYCFFPSFLVMVLPLDSLHGYS